MLDENSSNSDESGDFEGLIKKVEYDGNLVDSDEDESDSPKRKVKRKNYSKRISSLLEVDGADVDKTKNIKKNCISAKQSRQRKKIYIEALEKTADQLKKQILSRKSKIASNRDAIMAAIKESNPEKSRFISEYLSDNKNLSEQLTKLKSEPKTPEKEAALQHMINSYLYKFGFTGVLRRDMLEQLKMKWYQLAIDEKIIMNGGHNQLKGILERFKNCMNELEKKGLELEYLLRNLQYSLNQEDILKFIINPAFLLEAPKTEHSGSKHELPSRSEKAIAKHQQYRP